MKSFDVLVVGAGTGLEVAAAAERRGFSVALVEEGPMGGTCLNRGCIPSKMLIHSGDVAETIKNSKKFGITSSIDSIDFASITKRVSAYVDQEAAGIEEALKHSEKIRLYKARGKFTGHKTMEVSGETIQAEKVFIVGGSRPTIPKLKGLDTISYLTSTQALRLTKQPKHLVVLGGGYIGCELAHFYGSLGTKVTMIVRGDKLLRNEDEEIASWFTREFAKKHRILLTTEVEEFSKDNDSIRIRLKGKSEEIVTDGLLVATGIMPNTDILNVAATGVATNEKGYIKVNEYLETNVEGIWAFGDIIGILPFKHTANFQYLFARHNAFGDVRKAVDYRVIPHAVFSSPQVAGVGKTEAQLKEEGVAYRVGRYELKDTGMGEALQENGLAKVLANEEGKILGVHIVGPHASTLIHEAVVAMSTTGHVDAIGEVVYAHPALSEWLQRAFFAIE